MNDDVMLINERYANADVRVQLVKLLNCILMEKKVEIFFFF